MENNVDENELKKSIELLKKSPIFAMSLSSKELFHSNFWAWLISQDEDFIKLFFPSFKKKNENPLWIGREWHNFDLAIYDTNKIKRKKNYVNDCYVIENKIKSIPNENQLIDYRNTISSWRDTKRCGFLLVSLIEPTFKMPDEWSFLSYSELSKRIRTLLNESSYFNDSKNLFSRSVVENYCSILDSLVNIIQFCNEITAMKFNYLYDEEYIGCSLVDLRIHDVFRKLKSNDFISFFNNRINESALPKNINGFNLVVYPGYSHGEAFINIAYDCSNNDNSIKIGYQVQGYKANKFVDMPNKNNFNEIFDFATKDSINWLSRDFKTKEQKPYNKYNGKGKYSIVYQTQNVELHNKSYNEVSNYLINELWNAVIILKNIYVITVK